VDWISLFPEAAAALVHFHEEAAGSRAQADDFRALAAGSPVEAVDFRAQEDVTLGPVADFPAPVADSLASVVDSLELVAASWPAEALACSLGVRCFAQAADSRA
jgi:hypothetical protein